MSAHIGVSCDSCLKTNFSNRRYKCLICDNYDLCGTCSDLNAESQNHLSTHPMQCILTKTAYGFSSSSLQFEGQFRCLEFFYSGQSIPHRTIVSLTCPYCSLAGFLPSTLSNHCFEQHSDNRTSQMCPICVINPIQGHQIRFVSLADHILREHEHEDDKVEFDEDEDEGLPLYILAERLFLKEQNRRQRLPQILGRHDFHSQRRFISRQTAIRGSRGHPYGAVPRTTTNSFRVPSITSDPYAALLFSQDPLFGIDADTPFPDSITPAPFFLTSSIPSMTDEQKKSIGKQKRSNPIPQPVLFIDPSSSDHHHLNENNSHSLLGKILKSDRHHRVNNEEDHTTFLQSLLLSSLNISMNKQPFS